MGRMTEERVRIAFEFREFEAIELEEHPPRDALHRRVLTGCWHALISGLAMYAASFHGFYLDPADLPAHPDARRARVNGEDPWDF
jgi:hypothetical protein